MKKIAINILILLLLTRLSVFASDFESTEFFNTSHANAARNSGYGLTYISELDLYAAYGTKGSSALYVSSDGLNWVPRMTDFSRNILAFAYGNGKALASTSTTSTPVADSISNSAHKIYIFDKYLKNSSSVITVPDNAETTSDYVFIKGTMIWDEKSGKFWAGGCRYNETDNIRSHYGLYYSDGAVTAQSYDSAGKIDENAANNRSVMKWSHAIDNDDPYGVSEINTLYPAYYMDSYGNVVFDNNGNKTAKDYIALTSATDKYMNGPVISWITTNRKGHIIAGTGFSSGSYYPRTQMLMVDTSKQPYEYRTRTIGELKTAAIDDYDNIIFSISKSTGAEAETTTTGIYTTPWTEVFNGTTTLKTQITKVDGTAASGQYEVVEDILVLEDMVLCFPAYPATVTAAGALNTDKGDVKVITYRESGRLNTKYVTLFNHSSEDYSNSILYKFLNGTTMNKSAVNGDGRVVAMTGKPLDMAYSYDRTSKAGKILVLDTKNLKIDSSNIADQKERCELAQLITLTDDMDIIVNGVELEISDNQDFAVTTGDRIKAGYYEYFPDGNKLIVIAIYKDGRLIDSAISNSTANSETEKIFTEIPENCTAKVFFWNGYTLAPYTK